jgi:hypothetical protein
MSIVGFVMNGGLTNSKHIAVHAQKKYPIYFPLHILGRILDSSIVGFER